VVGGKSITITRNSLENIPVAAGILLAREANYQTFGVQNVLVDANVLRELQTLTPPYNPGNKFTTFSRTGHGGVEIQAALFADEAANPTLRSSLAVRNVVIRGNTIERSAVNGMRAGVNMSKTLSATDASGQTVTRSIVQGDITALSAQRNAFGQMTRDPMNIQGTSLNATGIHCEGNLRDGNSYRIDACKVSTAPPPNGALLRCTADGRVI
jgi:hypothetical protein